MMGEHDYVGPYIRVGPVIKFFLEVDSVYNLLTTFESQPFQALFEFLPHPLIVCRVHCSQGIFPLEIEVNPRGVHAEGR